MSGPSILAPTGTVFAPAGTARPASRLAAMDERAFLTAWREIAGGPPSVMLPRGQMIDILLATTTHEAVERVLPSGEAGASGERGGGPAGEAPGVDPGRDVPELG